LFLLHGDGTGTQKPCNQRECLIRLKAVFLAADLNGIISLNGHDGSFLSIPWLESWAVRGDKLMMRGKP
jgi:hypothetical protein